MDMAREEKISGRWGYALSPIILYVWIGIILTF
jgi:hypothetical protein